MDLIMVSAKPPAITYKWQINTSNPYFCEEAQLWSPFFSFGDHLWYVEVTLDNSTEELDNEFCHIKLFKYSRGVINTSQKMAYVACEVFSDIGELIGFSAVVNEFSDEASILCINYIQIPLSLFSSNKSPTVYGGIQLLENYTDLLNSTVFADVKFLIGSREIRAHTAVLASRNEVFRRMLYALSVERKNYMEIHDIDYETFEGLLQYIYCGVIINIDRLATRLLYASHMYELDYLFDMCVESLTSNLDVDNALEILALSVRYDLDDLFDQTQIFISENIQAVISSPEYENSIFKYPDVESFLEDIKFNLNEELAEQTEREEALV